MSDENGLMIKWADDGSVGLKFQRRDNENSLVLMDKNGRVLNIPLFDTTLPVKCAVDSEKIYCGVPREILPGTILPDDYLKRKIYLNDDILAWDIALNTVERLFDGNNIIIDVDNLSKESGKIFFINRYDRKLYSIDIGN